MRYPHVGTNVESSELADRVDLLPVDPNLRGTSSWKISNEYRPISGMCYLVHYHESSFAGIWERIMREDQLDWLQSKIFLVYNNFNNKKAVLSQR